MVGKKGLLIGVLVLLVVALLTPALGTKKGQNSLDDLVTVSGRLRVPQNIEVFDSLRAARDRNEALPQFDKVAEGWDAFLTRNGGEWQFLMDTRTGLPALVEGSGQPWIPGAGNSLRTEGLGLVTSARMESIARDFMLQNQDLFPFPQDEIELVPEGTVEVGGYFWHVQFQYVRNGVPVEGARIVFRVNNGNLVQFGMENVSPEAAVDTVPSFANDTAWEILGGYIGGFYDKDEVLESGKLIILPVVPSGDTGEFRGTVGRGMEYRLCYELVFHRDGVMGTWKARIDAHTGEILSFVDANKYGAVTGGIYPNSNLDTEVVRPLPFITVTNSTTKTCDAGGNYSFTAGTATASIKGKYVSVTDSCGTSSLSTTTSPGDLAFNKSSGTDCTTPGVGGSGNTHAARSTYFHLTLLKERALGFLPSNSWLSSALTDKVNLSQTCNAYWSGSYVAFFKSGGGCSNTGELPTVFLHEAGHGLDSNDGSADSTVGSSESYGDGMALLQTHDSCVGTNFIPGNKCSGYGDACTTCTGIRDADYAKHSSNTPAKPSQLSASSGFHCSVDSSYPGPCGYEGHCESYIMSEVIWDLGYRDLVSTGGLDANTAWYVADRLFYLSRPSSVESYTCSSVSSTNGCGTGNWFTTFRSIDDDDGNLTNGTPHGASIYAAFSRHSTACTSVTGYNTTYAAYTTPSKPTVTASTATAGQVVLSWSAVTGATRYTVLRNEMGANYGMMVLTSTPTTSTTYTDTAVAPGITYYYSVVGVGGSSLSTIGPMATIVSATPTAGGTTTYSISGTVSGAVASGVTMNLTGASSASATTASDGTYTFSGLVNGSYTVTPSKTGYTFSPASLSVTISGANQTGKNFTASAAATYSISGTVSGAVASGVAMSLSGAATASATTATDGTYTFSGLVNGTYTVTPSKAGYTFSPASTSVTISGASQTGKNFTSSVSSTAFSEDFSSVTAPALPSGWTTVVTSGNAWKTSASGCTGNALMYPYNTSSAGNSWAFSPALALTSGVTYTLTFNQKVQSASYPENLVVKAGTSATAAGQTIAIYSGASLTNTTCAARTGTFTVPSSGTYYLGFQCVSVADMYYLYVDDISLTGGAAPTTYSISGTVSGATASGVTITAGSATATTDASGNYTLSGLSNGTYTVTPSKSGYTFSPASISVTISGANQTGKNFTATAATTYSISGTVSGATSVTVSCTGQTSVTTSGTYTFSGLSNGTYTVAPSKTGYTFSPASYSVTISGANVTGKDFAGTPVSGGNVLTSGVGVSGSVGASAYTYYTFAVPSGATNLTVTLTNLSADVDLYDMAPSTAGGTASNPTTSSYTGRSWNSGTTSESLSHSSPTYGTWAIAAYGYAAGSYTVTATYTAGGTTYSISGTVSGAVASGVTVTAGSSTATTATDGTYTISGLANGTYTVTPSKSGYTFSPSSSSVTISGANKTGVNFTATASGGTTTNILQSPGFETSTGWSWTYSGTTHTWRTSSTTPVSARGGSYKAQLCSYTSTYYQSQTENLTQTVTIPSAATAASLNFYYYIKTAETTTSTAYDKLTITVENTSGTVLATLTTMSNLNKTTNWTQKTGLDLLSYKGQTVVLRFKGTTDSSLGTMFLLDDMTLNVTQ